MRSGEQEPPGPEGQGREASRPAGTALPVRAEELADEFGRTAKLLGARLADRLTGHGLSMPRANLLSELARHGPLRVTQLGDRVGISQGTASSLIEGLVRKGLVERRTDPGDGRAIQLAATDAGRERARAWRQDYEAAAEEVFAPLPEERRAELLTMLRTLADGHPDGG